MNSYRSGKGLHIITSEAAFKESTGNGRDSDGWQGSIAKRAGRHNRTDTNVVMII